MSAATRLVHFRVNDARTGQPTPIRIRLTDSAGNYLAPLGRLTEFATGPNQDVGGNLQIGSEKHAYIDGSCEISLPPGPISVEVAKGPEYLPISRQGALGAGQLALRLEVERWTDMRADGWYAGDCRVHFLSPHGALLEGAAEDLAVVNLLVTDCEIPSGSGERLPAISNLLGFSGRSPALERPGHIVVVNTHNRHPQLGSLALLNCHRVVYPLSFGGPNGNEDWTLADWCDQCHRKGGMVVWTREDADDRSWGEALADLVLGKIDAFEISARDGPDLFGLDQWYTLLGAGLRVPIVGSSVKVSNRTALGCVRTYARLKDGEGFSYKAWIDAVRAGRTFVTSGPLLRLSLDGVDPGAALSVAGGQPIQVRAHAASKTDFEGVEIIFNGSPILDAVATGTPASAVVDEAFIPPISGWLAARCLSSRSQALQNKPCLCAHTSPIYIGVDDRACQPNTGCVAALQTHLEDAARWVGEHALCESEAGRARLLGLFEEARKRLGPN